MTVEREKADAIEAERRKAAAEAEAKVRARLKAEAEEQERLEQERFEEYAKSANREHQAAVNREVMADMMEAIPEITDIQIKKVICAIAKGLIRHTSIRY